MRIEVVGTAQDGGVPHLGCTCTRCESARDDPTRTRYPASLLVDADERLLVDVPMDVRHQVRGPVDGIAVSHAHVGHFPGILQVGREVLDAEELPVYCTPELADVVRTDALLSRLVTERNVSLRPVTSGEAFGFGDGTIRPFAVPHRDELGTGTLGFAFEGARRLVYVPDVDRWTDELLARVGRADVALLDGTFWSADEIPDQGSVPHPPIRTALADLPTAETDVYFTHLNHTNPALSRDSTARETIAAAGAGVLERGRRFDLG